MDWRVFRLKQFIDNHAGGVDSGLKRACRQLGLDISLSRARYLFKRDIGLGVREYAKRERLLIAVERLIDSDVPVKTIASDLGYRTTYDFTRLFKERVSLEPNEVSSSQPPAPRMLAIPRSLLQGVRR